MWKRIIARVATVLAAGAVLGAVLYLILTYEATLHMIIAIVATVLAAGAVLHKVWRKAQEQRGFFTTVPQGEFITVATPDGSEVKNILVNAGNLHLTKDADRFGDQWLVYEEDGRDAETASREALPTFGRPLWWWIKKTFGVTWGGLWPFWNPYEFKVDTSRVRSENEIDSSKADRIRETAIDTNKGLIGVRHIRTLVKVPVLVRDVTLPGDASVIDIVLEVTAEAVIVKRLFYIRTIQEEVRKFVANAIYDWASRADKTGYLPGMSGYKSDGMLTYEAFRSVDKTTQGPMFIAIAWQNISKAYYDSLNVSPELQNRVKELTPGIENRSDQGLPSESPNGLIPLAGYGIREARVVAWAPDEETAKIVQAAQAEEIARLEAKAAIAKAVGERDAQLIVAEAEQGRIGRLSDVFLEKFSGRMPDEKVLQALQNLLTAEQLKELKGALGAAGMMVGFSPPNQSQPEKKAKS